jgi:hypothetical protein
MNYWYEGYSDPETHPYIAKTITAYVVDTVISTVIILGLLGMMLWDSIRWRDLAWW